LRLACLGTVWDNVAQKINLERLNFT